MDVLVLMMCRDKFCPKVGETGKKCVLSMWNLSYFFEYERIEIINKRNSNFNESTYETTAFKLALSGLRKNIGIKKGEYVVVSEIVINLPF